MTEDGKKKRDWVSALLVGLLLVGAVVMGWQEVLERKLLRVGSAAPEFSVVAYQGPPVSLAALRGKVVVVDFWASWCGPCREEMPALLRVVKEQEDRGLAFVAISNDDLGSQREDIAGFLAHLPALTPYAALGTPEVGASFLVHSLPTLYVIGRDGTILTAHAGAAPEWQLRRWIASAVEGR